MARIRSVHPSLWTDEAFVSVSYAGRLLSVGLWNEADDIGCFEWKPITFRMRIFPADNVDVVSLMNELVKANIIMRYEINGREFGAIRNFCKFQRPKAPKSIHPNTPEILIYVASDGRTSENDNDEDASDSEQEKRKRGRPPKKAEINSSQGKSFPTNSEINSQMEDGGDNRKKEPPKPPVDGPEPDWPKAAAVAACPAGFPDFWVQYPRKVAKADAVKAYAKALKNGAKPEKILQALVGYRFDFREDGRFIPHPATWLNGGRWEDENGVKPQQNMDFDPMYFDRDAWIVAALPEPKRGSVEWAAWRAAQDGFESDNPRLRAENAKIGLRAYL